LNNILRIDNLTFAYREQPVLEEVSVAFGASEFVGIIGPNGAGKSTLLKHMAGVLLSPEERIFIHDQSLNRIPRRKLARTIAYLPQEVDFVFSFTVDEVLRMGRFPHTQGIRIYSERDEQVIDQVSAMLNVHHFRARGFADLSGGEKQRVLIASALAQEPGLLLLDEPTSALDLHHQLGIYQILRSEQVSRGLTVVVVTHDINLAAQFCTRMILMDQGRILRDGPPDQVLQFQTLQDVFGVKVYIDINPMTRSLYILPYGSGINE
jgi:iron complex transport system ATP-binding protein